MTNTSILRSSLIHFPVYCFSWVCISSHLRWRKRAHSTCAVSKSAGLLGMVGSLLIMSQNRSHAPKVSMAVMIIVDCILRLSACAQRRSCSMLLVFNTANSWSMMLLSLCSALMLSISLSLNLGSFNGHVVGLDC